MTATGINTSSPNVSTYSKVLPVSIRKEVCAGSGGSGGGDSNHASPSTGGEQREFIRVTLAFPSPSCGTMNPHKEIALRLTNDENPLFYYHLRVTDAEFPQLRFQQGLLVDFYGFPGQLVTLLDKCDPNNKDGNEDTSNMKNSSFGNGPKFVLVMKVVAGGNTVLDIVESNPFKYLCHLSLQIIPGSDAEVKKFLCDVTTTIKKDYQLLSDKYNHLASTMETENNRIKSLLEDKCTELNLLRDEIHSQASSLSSKHFQEMNHEKEKLLKLQSELVFKFDGERTEIEKRHKAAMRTLEDRNAALEGENRDLSVCKFKQETALQDATNRLKIYEDDFKILQQEITVARKQNGKLDHDYHEKQRLVNTLQNRNTSLEADLKDKQNMVHRQQEMINSISNDKRKLEDNVQELAKELEKTKTVHKGTAQELVKGNEIIKKLQDDIRSSHSKNKVLCDVTTTIKKDYQLLTDKYNQLASTMEAENTRIKSQLEDKCKEHDLLRNEIQALRDEIQSLREKQARDIDMSSKHLQEVSKEKEKFQSDRVSKFDGQRGETEKRHKTASNNTTQGGSPSWLHIYQSTGNSNDHDLSSRLEHISALGAILNSQNAKNSEKQDLNNDSNATNDKLSESTKSLGKPNGGGKASTVKQPSWAKSKPKVTLDTMINKPTFPIWKNK